MRRAKVEEVIFANGRAKVTYDGKKYTILRGKNGELVRESLQYLKAKSLEGIRIERGIPSPVRKAAERCFSESDTQRARLL